MIPPMRTMDGMIAGVVIGSALVLGWLWFHHPSTTDSDSPTPVCSYGPAPAPPAPPSQEALRTVFPHGIPTPDARTEPPPPPESAPLPTLESARAKLLRGEVLNAAEIHVLAPYYKIAPASHGDHPSYKELQEENDQLKQQVDTLKQEAEDGD